MGCKIQYKIENKLKSDGILKKGQEITSLLKFEAINNLFTKQAEKFYGLDTYGKKLYSTTEKNSKIYAVPNTSLLDVLNTLMEEQGSLVLETKDFSPNAVGYNLKAISILNTPRAKQIFDKGKKNNWNLDKILTELQVPKLQKEIILDKNITDREEIITSLLADNSFVVDVNLSKSTNADFGKEAKEGRTKFTLDDNEYNRTYIPRAEREGLGLPLNEGNHFTKNGNTITKEEYYKSWNKDISERMGERPTQHYSNLTVPGGTKYTENEIATPAITPNIKGHAKFSTDKGIGWFRSDEADGKAVNKNIVKSITEVPTEFVFSGEKVYKESGEWYYGNQSISDESALFKYNQSKSLINNEAPKETKTRRILEFQSDLFQKGRDRKDLTNSKIPTGELETIDFDDDGSPLPSPVLKDNKNYRSGNQFLQLLNKKGNWVNFFIQSIVQDSAKKGYEKVLFPTGETAAKVEGHQTIADDIAKTNEVINLLKETEVEKNPDPEAYPGQEYRYRSSEFGDYTYRATEELAEQDKYESIKILEKRNQDRKEQGLEKLKPVEAFYTNRVTNILNKSYKGRIKQITDEYGNTWNEVTISDKDLNNFVLQTKDIRDLEDKNAVDFLSPIKNTNKQAEEFNKNLADEVFGTSDNITAIEILNRLQNNYGSLTQGTRDALDKLSIVLERNKIGIKFVDANKLRTANTFMQYNASKGIIEMSREKMEGKTAEYIIQAFLHEVVHSTTAKALLKPSTVEEQMFKDYIQQMYNKYLELSGVTDTKSKSTYGFSSPAEFVSEIMTNPIFQNEIKALDKNLWRKFIDFIRTMVGLRKTSDYHNIIEAITDISQRTDSVQLVTASDVLFETKDFEEEDKKYDLSTVSKKLDHRLNGIKDNIEENLRIYDMMIKTSKDASKIKTYSDKLKVLLKDIENLDETNKWKGISLFTDQLASNITSLQTRFRTANLASKDIEKLIHLYRKYLTSNNMIGDIQDLLSMASQDIRMNKADLPITLAEINKLKDILAKAQGIHSELALDFRSILKRGIIKKLSNPKFAGEVMAKWRKKVGKEYEDLKKLGLQEPKVSWVARQLNNKYADEITLDIENYVTALIESPAYDISSVTRLFVSSVNTNSKMVQIFQNLLNEVRETIVSLSRAKDFELRDLFDKFIGEKQGTTNLEKIYGKMIEWSSDGRGYLKGEYKLAFKEEYEKQFNAFKAQQQELLDTYGVRSTEYLTAYTKSDFRKWVTANTHTVKLPDSAFPKLSEIRPIDKWKNDFSGFSKIELETIEEFRNITLKTNKDTFGISSLVAKPVFNAKYMRLPSATRSDLEQILAGNAKGLVKDKWKDLSTIRPDDVGYEEVKNDVSGNPIYNIKVHYRGNIEKGQQSIDLFTLYRLEHKNGVNFKAKHKAEKDLTTLIEIIEHKEFNQTTGNRVPLVGKFIKHNKKIVSKLGKNSNTYQKVLGMMESNVYDILHKNAGKLGPADTNKVVAFMNGWTAKVGMSLNEVTAATNVLNGKAQLFLEAVAGNVMSKGAIAKAEKEYMAHIGGLFGDLTNPIKKSKLNQLNEMFDTEGLVAVSVKQAFIKNTVLKSGVSTKNLQFMQDSGEHWMQTVLAIAVLESIKVMNSNNEFINKDGKVVTTEKDAASLYDMLEMKDGILTVNDKVIYTTYNQNTKYNEGGKELVNNLIKKKLFDSFGNYDANMQPEAMRHAWGKLIMMYRRFLVPMGIARYRGFAYFSKPSDELEDYQKFFSDALQDYEEGFYTSFARYMWTGVRPALKNMELKLATTAWNDLSDMEKANIHKAITEMVITMVILPMLSIAIGAAVDGDDDDNEGTYFILLQIARLQTELASFRNPLEQYRVLKNPIPAVNVIQSAIRLGMRVVNPFSWAEEYDTGRRKGQLKVRREVEKLTPILNSTNISYKEKYEFITTAKMF